jgi:hypothetical protein
MGKGTGRGRLERFLFSFMGPPELGDVSAPVREVERPVQACSKCGQPYDEHEIVRDPRLTWARCPGS